MNAAQLLILHKEHQLSIADIALVLGVHKRDVEEILTGRIKPSKPKRTWLRSRQKYNK